MASFAVLKHVQSRDPDGGSVQPTENDYRAFEAWVVKTYGRNTWVAYQGNWDKDNGEDWE